MPRLTRSASSRRRALTESGGLASADLADARTPDRSRLLGCRLLRGCLLGGCLLGCRLLRGCLLGCRLLRGGLLRSCLLGCRLLRGCLLGGCLLGCYRFDR